MAMCHQFIFEFGEIVYLAVKDNTLGSILIVYRLTAAFQVDNAQPAMAHVNGVITMIAIAIRPPVSKRIIRRFKRIIPTITIYHSKDATHTFYSPCSRGSYRRPTIFIIDERRHLTRS
jgi:hypothetical protein